MLMWRIVTTLLFAGGLAVFSAWESRALAATPVVSDLTDFIQRLGGYVVVFDTTKATQPQLNWEQISYKVTAATSPSNLTTIVMTMYPKVASYAANGTSNNTAISAGSTPGASLSFCAVTNYTVETITLDLRDIQATAVKAPYNDNGNSVWKVTLQTATGKNLIRQNTQTLPATCPVNTTDAAAVMQQKDVSQYAILFADPAQASQFAWLVSNVIPTFNAPILIGTPPN